MDHNKTAMIAFDMSDLDLTKILKYPGTDPKELHVTLISLGEVAKLDLNYIDKALRVFADAHAPMLGCFSGYAVFPANAENDNKAPIVALLDSPDLPAFRQALVRYLGSAIPDQNHGFTPHMTLDYTKDPAITLPSNHDCTNVDLHTVTLYIGGYKLPYPLSGSVTEKEARIGESSKAKLYNLRVDMFNKTVDVLADRVFTGQISIGSWEEQMKAEIKALHSATAVIGKGGWGEMSPSDWGRVGSAAKAQYKYLHNFADTLQKNAGTISAAAIRSRSHMYGTAAKLSLNQAAAGEFAGGTKRQPGRFQGLPWMPGDGSTDCLINCKCKWILTVAKKTKTYQEVHAVWTLSPAEHCDTCIKRNGHVEIMSVPLDVVVPSSIGGI